MTACAFSLNKFKFYTHKTPPVHVTQVSPKFINTSIFSLPHLPTPNTEVPTPAHSHPQFSIPRRYVATSRYVFRYRNRRLIIYRSSLSTQPPRYVRVYNRGGYRPRASYLIQWARRWRSELFDLFFSAADRCVLVAPKKLRKLLLCGYIKCIRRNRSQRGFVSCFRTYGAVVVSIIFSDNYF